MDALLGIKWEPNEKTDWESGFKMVDQKDNSKNQLFMIKQDHIFSLNQELIYTWLISR